MSQQGATIIPTMRYQECREAIEWLCRVFEFEERMVVPGDGGTIAHAQLTCGNGMVMVSSAGSAKYDELIKPPGDVGGIGTQSAYIVVDDVKAHHDRVVEAGGTVVIEYAEEDYGAGYSVRDLEGHIWNFGDYNPWVPVEKEEDKDES